MGVSLSARIVDMTGDAGDDVAAAPPTASAWKLDALAIGALLAGALLVFALHKGLV